MKIGAFAAALLGFLLSFPAVSQIQPARLEAIDSLGNVIGPVIDDGGSEVTVPLLVSSHTIRAGVTAGYMSGPPSNQLLGLLVAFASSDCSGPPFVDWPAALLGEPFAIVTQANSVYAGARAMPQSMNIGSHFEPGVNGCVPGGIKGRTTLGNAVAVTFIRNLSPPFQPPFDIRATAAPNVVAAPAVGLTGLGILTALLAFVALRVLRRTARLDA